MTSSKIMENPMTLECKSKSDKTSSLEDRARTHTHTAMVSLARITAVVVGLLAVSNMVESVPNTNITTVLCNSGSFTAGDPFATSLAYVLDDLMGFTPSKNGYDYYNISPYPNAFAYGHARCNSSLISGDCTTCLRASKQALFSTCQSRIGARSVLYDCRIRYEQYPFNE
ncbi:hypothetical protein IFM89_017511 [Coptis chinensis]|uniref:Gnk2-homologous domain-containing protein n=1 Tax=Coptis chinensis TaxID=261450 RepID=A0A835HW52_9MAGN|nr:hypothetical protein IFM89_017511 [Coptis chinensis]